MTKRVAALTCCLSIVHGSVVAAEDIVTNRPVTVTAAIVSAVPHEGPLRRASLSRETQARLRAQLRWNDRTMQDDQRPRGSWMERHPVLTGALVGFGTGVAITYAVAHDDKDEFIRVISPGAAALFWGGVSAGVGALAGWGIGRNREDRGSTRPPPIP